jgi:hypothetical protein
MPKKISVTTRAPFKGYSGPSYTMVPDELFDEQLSDLSGAELKVLLYIMRRTFGFKKEADDISLNQICRGITTRDGRVLDKGTGLSQSTVVVALKGLVEANIATSEHRSSAERGHEATTYRLNVVDPLHRKSVKAPSPKIGYPLHRKSDTQYTVLQKTDLSISKYSKAEASVSELTRPTQHFQTTQVHRQPSAPTPIGTLLGVRRSIVPGSTTVRLDPRVAELINTWSVEWHDSAHLRSNLTQVRHIQEQCGWSGEAFVQVLLQAHATTKQDGHGARKKMPYCFAVLRDLVGIRTVPDARRDVNID